MAATVDIMEWNGTSGSEASTSKTSGTVRFKKADNATVDSNNPLVRPGGGGTDRSYEKWLRLRIGGTGPSGSITNPQLYSDGGNGLGTGVSAYIRTTNPGSYATPAIPGNDSAGTNLFTYVTGSRKDMDAVNAGPFTGTNTNIGDYAVLWFSIADTAGPGTTPSETLTWTYDET